MKLVVDLILDDPRNDEHVICLVEAGPWLPPLETRLRALQERLYNSFDAIVDGHLANKFPQSKGRKVRLQVDLHDSPPQEMTDFVRKFSRHLESDPEFKQAIAHNTFISSLGL